MASSVNVDTKPLGQYIIKLQKGGSELAEKLAKALAEETTARIIAVGAVDTGELRDSPKATPTSGGNWQVEVEALHGSPVNYGTWKMAARPFWEPAIEATRAKLAPMAKVELAP